MHHSRTQGLRLYSQCVWQIGIDALGQLCLCLSFVDRRVGGRIDYPVGLERAHQIFNGAEVAHIKICTRRGMPFKWGVYVCASRFQRMANLPIGTNQ